MDAGQYDYVGIGVNSALGQRQRVAGDIGDAMVDLKPQEKIISIISEQTCQDFISIIVRDTGVGLDIDQPNEQLFQPFYSTKTHGMGMGLAISHSIVHNHGGKLCANKNYSDGAEFSFTLPVMPILGDH